MCWIKKSRSLFESERPIHFVERPYCDESSEHEDTLQRCTIDSIGLEELGNPGWDPMCFCNAEGKKYYFPALIRLSLDTIESDFYFAQLLFHLSWNGKENDFYVNCSDEQRSFVASFIESMIKSYPKEIDKEFSTDEALEAYEIWSHA